MGKARFKISEYGEKQDPRFAYILIFFYVFTISAELSINYLVCLGLTFAMLAYHVMNHKTIKVNAIAGVFIVMFFAMLLNLRASSDSSLTFWLYWICGLGFAFCWNYDYDGYDSDINRISHGWIVLGLLAVIVVIISKIDPSFYLNTISRFVSNTTRQYNTENIRAGYSGSICRGISYTCYFLTFALSFILCGNYTKKVKIISVFLFGVSLIASGRRGETLAAFASVLIYLFYSVDRNKKSTRKFQIIFGIVGIAILVYILWPKMSELSIFYRYTRTISRYQRNLDFTSGRFELYEIALEQFKKHPFFGIGWASFKSYLAGDANLSNAHNIYLQLLCETGIVGTFFILTAYITLLVKTISLLNKYANMRINSNGRQLCLFALMAQVFFLVTGLVDNPIYKPIIGMFYALIIIFVSIAQKDIKRNTEQLIL